jgi:hypothetical protein
MSDLLQEVVNEILLLGEAGKSKKYPGYYKMPGFDLYATDPNSTVATHKVDKATGKLVVIQDKEPSIGDKPKAADTTPAAQRKGVVPQAKPIDTTKLKKLADRLSAKGDTRRAEVVSNLTAALESGDQSQIKDIVDKLGLYISKEGKLKATSLGATSDERKVAGDNKDFARYIYDMAKSNGVEIPGESDETSESPEPQASSEEFKPQSVFRQDKLDQLDVKDTDGGVEVEGVKLEEITDEAKITEIENDIVNRAKQTRGGELTPEHEDRIRKYVRARIEANNHNIQYLRDVANRGGKLPAHQFTGEEGSKRIVERTTPLLEQHIPNEKKRAEAQSALDDMASAKTPREFNAAYERFSKAVKGTAIQKNMKYVAETLTALRVTAMGGTALIPQSDSFPLADVISVKRSPITGEVDIEQILVDVDEEQEVTTAGSVKVGKGAGSGNKPKIENSRFDTGEVDGVDCSEVVDDLSSMTDISSRNAIFTPTQDGQPTPEAKKQIMGWLKKYGPMVRAYFGIEDEMSDEELYEFLSYGKEMTCVDGKPSPTPDGPNGKPFKQAEKPNGGQWRAWSVVGRLTEAVHNRTVRQQYYHTVRYNGVVKTADGIRRLSKMAFQPFKNEAKMKGTEGNTRPDQAQNGFTIPATIEETANGNPCTQ